MITPNHRCDTYGNSEMGWRFYPMLDDVKFIEASKWTYISVDLIRLFNLAFRFRFNINISLFIIYYFYFPFYPQPCWLNIFNTSATSLHATSWHLIFRCMMMYDYNDISYATSLHATSWHLIFRFMMIYDYNDISWKYIIYP